GDLPGHVIFRRAGRAHGAVFRRGDRRAVERTGAAAMPMLLPIFADVETSRHRRTAGVPARPCVFHNWNNRLCLRNSRFYSTQTDPNSLANPNLSFNHRASKPGGRAMSRMGIFLVVAVWLSLVAPARPASAADLVLKAPTAAPAFDWTGFYVG